MDYNPSNQSLGKTLTKIIIVMKIIVLATSPDRTTITLEKIGSTIDHMDHEFPNMFS